MTVIPSPGDREGGSSSVLAISGNTTKHRKGSSGSALSSGNRPPLEEMDMTGSEDIHPEGESPGQPPEKKKKKKKRSTVYLGLPRFGSVVDDASTRKDKQEDKRKKKKKKEKNTTDMDSILPANDNSS